MGNARLFWKLYLSYLVAVALCAGVVGLLAVRAADDLYHSQARSDLQARAELVRAQVAGVADPGRLQSLVKELGTTSDTRVTVIAGPASPVAAIGKVLADSQANPAAMENHDTPGRPEVQAALAGHTGDVARGSRTLHEQMLYVAIPLFDGAHRVVAVVRTALPLTELNHALDAMTRRIIVGTLVVAVAVAALGLVVWRRFVARMREIQRGADRFASGDFSHEVHVARNDEIGALAASLNRMGRQLNETIRTITGERNEREAVLAGMTEGVLAVDGDERIITMNAAAGGLLGVAPSEAEGRTLHETVRNPDLQAFVASALASDDPVESAIVVYVGQEARDLQAHGSRLAQGDGAGPGAVVVLNDVTRLRHFEAVRRDFVANVSHEIKTPVTSIKGFAETLLDGALDDRADAERFLRIIVGQADRLGAIIGDLLSLSNLESGAEGAAIPLERGSVRDVLQVAVGVCDMKAAAKSIALSLSCPDELYAEINPPLLEQAVVNLIDNAVKYSPVGSTVEVSAAVEPTGLAVTVRDHGPGIAREHLARLFERFYRVDKARSRDMGGTGLGLSIVKHIAVAHGGWVSVESTPGLGSTFTITLPA
jgi:two-component system phosphate regulon sensor histidine kinase PhoR